MIEGKFSNKGELFFEIDFVAADGLIITVDALLDTGFTDWLAINTQDAVSLGWQLVDSEETRLTARGEAQFNIYAGTVRLDGQQYYSVKGNSRLG
ncbi:aspartyl protease [Scytonema sp. UIC 10036]|uniref:aspartyl protease n=1 Tax=Scytonema sp. UIC 10036 TaxID=2304196 RepID=UPI001A9A8DFA|nr:aspartyl protease [Scytonema sp. UIC 10036]